MESKQHTFVRGASLLSFLTLISRILGLLREAVCAYFFGVSAIWDDFMLAFCVPNLSRRLFGEGALSAAFVPVMSDKLARGQRPAARLLLGRVLTLLAAILCAAVVIGEVLLLALKNVIPATVGQFTAIMLPYMVFICLVALLGGAHNALGRFAAPAFMPILFNILFIYCTVLAVGHAATLGQAAGLLAAGVVLAGALQLLLQWLAVQRAGCGPRLSWAPQDPDLTAIMRVMAPMILGLSAVQINTLGDMVMARVFVDRAGGVSSLTYAARLYQLPVGLFGAALATAILPGLSRLVSAADERGFAHMLERGLRLSLFVGVPASLGLCVVGTELVGVLFERGRFEAADTLRVSRVVWAYGVGVWAYISQQVLVRGFYARRRARTPMRISASVVGVNLALNLLLVHWLQEAGIALATAVSAALQLGLLLRAYHRQIGGLSGSAVLAAASRALLAGLLMVAAVWAVRSWMIAAQEPRSLTLFVEVATGVAVYGISARLGQFREFQELLAALRAGRASRSHGDQGP